MRGNLNNPYTLVLEGLKVLPKRTKDIIMRRFGINQREAETLEAIGKKYGITRERVRQIEEDGLSRLKKDEASILFKPVVSRLESYLRKCGDLRKNDTLLKEVTSLYFPGGRNAGKEAKECPVALNLVLTISEPFKYFRETQHLHPVWSLSRDSFKEAEKVVSSLVKYLNSYKNTVQEKEIMDWFLSEASHVSRDAHLSFLDAAKLVEKNLFGEYGLVHWPVISPRGVKDKAYLVFKKEGNPIHFARVAELINETGISKRKAYAQTVHNELIKDERFVLVGRGLYALSEWGYAPGTVRDVIKSVLQEAGRPLAKEEIIDEVLKRRVVKHNTVSLNIQNSPEFKKVDDDTYVLVK